MSSTAHRPPSAVQCRLAIWSDINAMAEIAAQAFDQNDLCGRYMHPHRHEFPDDYIRFFRQETRSSFFEPGVWFLVTTAIVDEGEEIGVDESRNEEHVGSDERPKQEVRVSVKEEKKEVEQQTGKKVGEKMEKKEGQRVIVVGAAKWKRQGKGRRRYSSWMNALLHPPLHLLTKSLTSLSSYLSPIRSANPLVASHLSTAFSLIAPLYWTGPRAETFFLDMLCVAPAHQRRGHGRAMVQWGKDRAAEEKVCASLTSAEGKEGFYERMGFVSAGGKGACVGPLEENGVKGGEVMFWDGD